MISSGDTLIDDLISGAERGDSLKPLLSGGEDTLQQWFWTVAPLQTLNPNNGEYFRMIHSALGKEERIGQWYGAFGFLCFQDAVEQSQLREDCDFSDANTFLAIKETQEFIRISYKIDETYLLDCMRCTLHRVGTTSYILKAEQSAHDYAIKILKPRYVGNSRIRGATETYMRDYGHMASRDRTITPVIHRSSDRSIVMDFVEGETLAEAIANRSIIGDKEQLDLLYRLLDTVRKCSHYGIVHSDLSPDNIILIPDASRMASAEGEYQKQFQPMLIDFGVNYVLLEGTGGAAQLRQRERYFTEKLLRHPEDANILDDVYFLGVLFIDVLVPHEAGSTLRDIGYDFDELWETFPELGPLVGDMIDQNPKNRLLGFTSKRSSADREKAESDIYTYLCDELRLRRDLHEKLSKAKQSFFPAVMSTIGQFIIGPSIALTDQIKSLKVLGWKKGGEIKWLIGWAALTLILHSTTILVFGIYTRNDLGTWKITLPGRLVALTFSFVAVRYYLNVFATLSAKGIDSRAEFMMRSVAIVPWIWIMCAITLEPRWWPFWASAGAFFVAFNNFMCARLVRDTFCKSDEVFKLPRSHRRRPFENRLKNWAFTMLVYGGCLFGIGILLLFAKLAVDEWVYALVIAAIINMIIIFWKCCTQEAPMIRGGLHRALVLSERLRQQACRRSLDDGL